MRKQRKPTLKSGSIPQEEMRSETEKINQPKERKPTMEETHDTSEKSKSSQTQNPENAGFASTGAGQPPIAAGASAVAVPPDFVPLEGSARGPIPGSSLAGPISESDNIKLTVYLWPKPLVRNLPAAEDMGEVPPQFRRYATASEIDALFGADPADLDRVAAYAVSKGLEVTEKDPSTRSIRLLGPVAAAVAAFPTQVAYYQHATTRYRGRSGPVYIPAEFEGVIENIFGFDNRLLGAHQRQHGPVVSRSMVRPNAYLPPQVAQLYDFPPQQDGSGQCIGILVFNGQLANTGITAPGGYNLTALQNYFQNVLKIRMPQITDVVVHGPGNSPDPSDQNDVSDEVMLDIQTAGSCAPGARLVMYFTEFTEQGWVDAIVKAVHDNQNNPSVLSISYGNPEDVGDRGLWTNSAINAVNRAFQVAAYKGITVCCSAGDQGSTDLDPNLSDGASHVDFPASSPYVLGCGGTRLESKNGSITAETVWNNDPSSATGGGVSALFPLPKYQRYVSVPRSTNPGHRIGRGVPDVSGLADPETGVMIMNVDGTPEKYPVGGTSLTTPLWAALIARINQALGVPVGFLNPILYKYCASGVLRDITVGDNGTYAAAAGYDAVTGLGSIEGSRLLAALQALGSAPHIVDVPTNVQQTVSTDDRLARIEAGLAALAAQHQVIAGMLTQIARAANIAVY